MFEALETLFSAEDTDQTMAIFILLFISFAIGALIWAFLMHFPSQIKLKKELNRTKENNSVLDKENSEINERFTLQAAELKKSRTVLETALANSNRLNEKTTQLQTQLKTTQEQLELFQTQARNQKEANKVLLEQHQGYLEEITRLKNKIEQDRIHKNEFQLIVEEVEQEKLQLSNKAQNALIAEQTAIQNSTQLQQHIELLKIDLNSALEEKITTKNEFQDLRMRVNLNDSDNTDLKTQIVDLSRTKKTMEADIAALLEQLTPFLDAQTAKEKAAEEEEQMYIRLENMAKIHLEEAATFQVFENTEFIEDINLLEESLKNLQLIPDVTPEAQIEIDEETLEQMQQAMALAEQALTKSGFYEHIEPNTLVAFEEEDLDTLAERYMSDAAANIHQELFSDSLTDDEAVLEDNLNKITNTPLATEEEPIQFSDEENKSFELAFETASIALEQEGLFQPINKATLLDDNSLLPSKNIDQTTAQLIATSLPVPQNHNKDNLRQIEGIGAFIEQRLNDLGIYTLTQIEALTVEAIQALTNTIGFAPETIERDNWVTQAKELLKNNPA
jgi:predicted flap endonuclease-1-like 5' DNA nuclease